MVGSGMSWTPSPEQSFLFHDTRHSAVTNMIASGTGEAVAMSITGHLESDYVQALQPLPRFRSGGSSGTPERLSRRRARHDADRAGDRHHEVTAVHRHGCVTGFRAHHWHTRPLSTYPRHPALAFVG